MADKTIFYVVLLLACIITIWFVLTSVIYPTSSPTIDEVGIVNNTTAYPFVHTAIIVHSVKNASITCPSSNWTADYSANTIIMNAGTYCKKDMSYTINYDYRNDPTVLGVNFGFIVIFLGITMLLILLNVFKKK